MAIQGERLGPNASAKQPGTEPEIPKDIKSALKQQVLNNNTTNTNNTNYNNINKKSENKSSDKSILNSINNLLSQIFQSIKSQENKNENISKENLKILNEISSKLTLNSEKKSDTFLNQKISVDLSTVSEEVIAKFINTFRSEVLDSLRNNVQSISTKLETLSEYNSLDTFSSSLSTFLNDYKIITNNFINNFKTNTIDISTFNEAISKFDTAVDKFQTQNLKIEDYLSTSNNILENFNESLNTNFKSLIDNYINSSNLENISSMNSSINQNENIISTNQIEEYFSQNSLKSSLSEFSKENIENFITSFEKSTFVNDLNSSISNIITKEDLQKTEELLNQKIDSLKEELITNLNLFSKQLEKNQNTNINNHNITDTKISSIVNNTTEILSHYKEKTTISSTSLIPSSNITTNNISKENKLSPDIKQQTLNSDFITNDEISKIINESVAVPSNNTLNEQSNEIDKALLLSSSSQNTLVDDQFKSWTSLTQNYQKSMLNILQSIQENIKDIKNDLNQYIEDITNERNKNNKYKNSLSDNSNFQQEAGNNVFTPEINNIINEEIPDSSEKKNDESSGGLIGNAIDLIKYGKKSKTVARLAGGVLRRGSKRAVTRTLSKIGR